MSSLAAESLTWDPLVLRVVDSTFVVAPEFQASVNFSQPPVLTHLESQVYQQRRVEMIQLVTRIMVTELRQHPPFVSSLFYFICTFYKYSDLYGSPYRAILQ